MPRHEKESFPRTDHGCTKARNVTTPICLEEFMVKEMPVSLDYGDTRKLLVRKDLTNENSTRVKQRIRILDHPKNR